MRYTIVYTVFPDLRTTQKIIRKLVSKKLAACGNIFKITSIYTWKGKIERTGEYGTFIKTKASLYKKVEQYIKQNHPYEVPEIISWSIEKGLNKYLDWIDKST